MRRAAALLLAAAPLVACDRAAPAGVDIALADSGAGNPTVAIADRAGSAFAAWIETVDGESNVYIAEVNAAARGDRVRVNDIRGDAAPHDQAPPQVAVGPDGVIYVVWQNNTVIPGRRFPASNLRLARSLDGGRTFEPAIFVNDDALGTPASHTFQDIAVARDGTIYVSWIDGRTRAAVEEANAPPGDAHAAHGAMPGSEVRVAKSTDGGRSFSAGAIVHADVCPCCRTSLATGDAGQVAVAFRSATNDIRDVVVVRSFDGGATFGDPVVVHEDGWVVDACPHAGPSLAWDADGRLHVAWYTGSADRQGIWYARSTPDGSAFEAPDPLQTGGWVPVSQVKLATAPDGNVWIAWDDRREAESVIRVAVRGDRVRTLPFTLAGRSPAIAAGTDVVLAWQHGDAAAARVLHER